MPALSPALEAAIRRLVDDLVAGDFAAIAADGRIGRLSTDELRRAISDYGKTLVSLTLVGLRAADVYPSAVDVTLWTAEEGRSDLTLSLTIVDGADGPVISIDDLHVL